MGPECNDMMMFEINSLAEIHSFPLTRWGIPEPPMEIVSATEQNTEAIEVIILPGCAFDSRCNRLGHGKGYYGKIFVFLIVFQYGDSCIFFKDSFLRRCFMKASADGRKAPVTVVKFYLSSVN